MPYMYTNEVYTINVTALTNVPLNVMRDGKKPKFLPPNAKSSTDLVEVILPRITPRIVKEMSTEITNIGCCSMVVIDRLSNISRINRNDTILFYFDLSLNIC